MPVSAGGPVVDGGPSVVVGGDVRGARTLEYQPALDGLRALAVGAVMAYHGDVAWMRGGYLGVDVFFVLSGYLITTILVVEWSRTSGISLRGFWARRARRLLPALFFMLAGAAAYAWLLAEPDELARLRGDALATLGYVANWRYVWSSASYFEQFGVPSPLRHTWSLAIEEQWYLLWPLIVLALMRVGRGGVRLLGSVSAAGAIISAVLMAVLFDPAGDWSRVYYGTDTRVQGLLVGAALAALLVAVPHELRSRSGRVVDAAALIGLAGLAWCVWAAADTAEWMYRGGFFVVALSAAVVIAAAVRPRPARSGRSIRSLLSTRPLRAVGRISYGLYLWHWPVDVALTSERVGFAGPGLFAARTAVAVALAGFSYRVVERPIRVRDVLRTWRAARLAVTLTAIATVVAIVAATAGAHPLHGVRGDSALSPSAGPDKQGTEATKPSVLFVGDSSALTLAYNFDSARWHEDDWHFVATLGCGVIRGDTVSAGRTWKQQDVCRRWPRQWAAGVAKWDVDLAVVQIGAWEVLDASVDGKTLKVGTPEHSTYLAGELQEAIDVLSAGGALVAFLKVPCFGPSSSGSRFGSERTDTARVAAVNEVLATVVEANPGRAEVIDLAEWLCPGGRYAEKIDGLRVRYDGVHFDAAGAAAFWARLAPKIESLAKTPHPASGVSNSG